MIVATTNATDRLVLNPAMRREAIIEFLRSARRRIVLSLFRCDDTAIVDEVAASVSRGVGVQILMTQRAHGWNRRLRNLFVELQTTGATVQRYANDSSKYHAKYIVVDDRTALVTSLNFTHKCFAYTDEFMLFTEDPEVVNGLKMLFEIDSYEPGSRLPAMAWRLLVAPDQARNGILEFFRSAQKDISIIDHRLTDPQVLSLLADKRRCGVSVRISGKRLPNVHGRLFLIDHMLAIIGSMHLSPPSLDSRREVGVITRDPAIVAELYDRFHW